MACRPRRYLAPGANERTASRSQPTSWVPRPLRVAATNHSSAGVCGAQSLIATGPRQVRFDLAVVKAVLIVGRVKALFRAEMLNAFNHPWFTPVNANNAANTQRVYGNTDNFRVRAVGENSSRIIQLVTRVSW